MEKLEEIMEFVQDDGYVFYTEFIYKVMQFKYDKLNRNIFII
jgi:hypothetical protein